MYIKTDERILYYVQSVFDYRPSIFLNFVYLKTLTVEIKLGISVNPYIGNKKHNLFRIQQQYNILLWI